MLPFSHAEFFAVFAAYNSLIWPQQVMATVLGVVATGLVCMRPRWSDQLIVLVLTAFWGFMAIVYHWAFFTRINPAAYVFGALYLVAAALFFREGVLHHRMVFRPVRDARAWVAGTLLIYAIIIYPVLGLLLTPPYPETPLFGVAPCPTTIFTLALLLMGRHARPVMLAGIPLIWSAIGGSAAIMLEVPQDWGLMVAGLAWLAVFITHKQHMRLEVPDG